MVLKVDDGPAMEEEIKAAAAMAVDQAMLQRSGRDETTKSGYCPMSQTNPQPEGWGE
jgi:hypothetical protein